MKATLAMAFGAAVLLAAASAQAQPTQQPRPVRQLAPESGATITSPFLEPMPSAPPRAPRHLFTIGKLPVGIWAPVPPPYDARANRNNAANPLWYDSSGLY
jgi:hypothetical protein